MLITGRPGIGKTTVIRRLAENLARHNPRGFYTAEIRERGIRRGFELVDLRGERLVLAHVDFPGTGRVGKYGIDLARFNAYLQEHNFVKGENGLIIIDEIGKMECLSRIFVDMIWSLLDSEKILIATIAQKGREVIADIKARPDIELIHVTSGNRNALPDQLRAGIENLL